MAQETALVPSKGAIRTELEDTKRRYHQLLDSLSPEDWNKKSANPSWNVRQLMWHLANAAGFILQGIDHCRKGKGPNPPQFLVNPANNLMTTFGARGATPESVAAKYDAAHAKFLAALEGVQDDEWQKSAVAFGSETTIEQCFHDLTVHFNEHEADILKGLGRA